ncbi:MAG: dihydrodipicolinate synthase family protein [Calditrichaeota bacterium]|nr:MAG: dihydrodipicolinate synthase family protein [Calditrichota bacterium]MBL1206275.1 dihydrodipicolinate synthase family protein [Calditrichota bacterium]NOG46101.1 dihydrodipicolinate synthase family protein [Calditrichota bacterium]
MNDWKLAHGFYTATLTPLKDDLQIDNKKLIDHCTYLLECGCDGIVLMGTTGEANSFSVAERQDALDRVISAGIPAQKLLVGTGCCALPDSLNLTRHALSKGVGGVLMLPPFYYKNVSVDGLFYSFERIINEINDPLLEIYLYHFPQMSSMPIEFKLIEKLLNHFPDHIAGIKDSGGDWQNMLGMHEKFSNFRVFAGTEKLLTNVKKNGLAGCISASTNISSKVAAKLFHENENQKTLQNKLNNLRDIVSSYPMISALKMVLARHLAQPEWLNMRPPHLPLKKEAADKLFDELEVVGFPEEFL